MKNKDPFTTACSQFQQEKVEFFLDAPDEIGKTFLILLIQSNSKIQSNNGIAFAVASSGIAATLLDEYRATYSVFKLPLNI